MDAEVIVSGRRPAPDGAGEVTPRVVDVGTVAGRATRLHYVDWLRVGAILSVVLYHGLRAFDTSDWHVKNAETSELLRAGMTFFESFGLGLLFLLAGAGARFALRRRTWQTFVGERTRRLLVPFIAGVMVLGPFQGFLEALNKGTYSGSYVDYIGPWFGGAAAWMVEEGVSPSVFGVGYHLWFLGFLFAFSLIGVPLFGRLAGGRGQAAIDGLARRFGRPGASLAFAVPIALLVIVFLPLGSDQHDWGEFAWYFGYFVAGYVLMADERFVTAVRRDLVVALVVGIVSSVALVAVDFGDWLSSFGDRGLDWAYAPMIGLYVLEGWAWTIVVLNIGLRVSRLQQPVSGRVGEAVLPIYVIHQPVILAVAFFVVQWPLGILPKAAIVVSVSLAITLLLVEICLRIPIVRLLLGARAPSAR